MHCVSNILTVSALLWVTHCVQRICSSPEAGWLEDSLDEGAIIAGWRCGHLKSTCTLELVPHKAV